MRALEVNSWQLILVKVLVAVLTVWKAGYVRTDTSAIPLAFRGINLATVDKSNFKPQRRTLEFVIRHHYAPSGDVAYYSASVHNQHPHHVATFRTDGGL